MRFAQNMITTKNTALQQYFTKMSAFQVEVDALQIKQFNEHLLMTCSTKRTLVSTAAVPK